MITVMLPTSFSEFQGMLHALDTDPLDAIVSWREGFGIADKGYQDKLYLMLSGIYTFAQMAQRDPVLMESFLKRPEWISQVKQRDPKNILRLSLLFFFNAGPQGTVYNRACAHERALRSFFNQGVPASDIYDRIHAGGGLEELARSQAKAAAAASLRPPLNNPHPTTEGVDDDDNAADGSDTLPDGSSPTLPGKPGSKAKPQAAHDVTVGDDGTPRTPKTKPLKPDLSRFLWVEVTDQQMRQALTRSTGAGFIEVYYESIEDEWRTIRAIDLTDDK